MEQIPLNQIMREPSASNKTRRSFKLGTYILMALAAGIPVLSELFGEPSEEAAEPTLTVVINDDHLSKDPVRVAKGLKYIRTGMVYDCMECHRSLEAKWHLPAQLMEHGALELNHGSNRFCLNCHHPKNRNAYVDYDGSEIAASDTVLLCAKCHGPQHRDWIIGAHGRRNGYWDTSRGVSERLKCIQCHDPHDPSFKAMKPMAGPTYPSRAAGERHHANTLHEEAGIHGK